MFRAQGMSILYDCSTLVWSRVTAKTHRLRPCEMLERAIKVAIGAHAGQVDKNSEAYVLHPVSMMLSVAKRRHGRATSRGGDGAAPWPTTCLRDRLSPLMVGVTRSDQPLCVNRVQDCRYDVLRSGSRYDVARVCCTAEMGLGHDQWTCPHLLGHGL